MNEHAYYIIQNFRSVLTEGEEKTVRTMRGLLKTTGAERQRAVMRKRGWIADRDPEVLRLLADGEDAFWDRLVTRVRAEWPAVVWNECVKCGGLTRTPLARQCLHCGHDWH